MIRYGAAGDPNAMTIPQRPFAWFELPQLGVSQYELRHLLESRAIRRMIQGIYAPADLEDTIELRAAGAALVLADHMVLADRTAAWLHGVDHYRLDDLSGVPSLDVVSVGGPNATRRRGARGGKRDLDPSDICQIAGVRATTPARTAADLACLFGRREAVAVLDAFMRTCHVTRDELDLLVTRFAGRRGVTQLRNLVPIATPLAESTGESWTRTDIIDAGLPAPTPQCSIRVNGVEKFRLDLAYPQWKVAIEYDGADHHTSPDDRAHDAARRDWLRRHGWIVIVVTKEDFRTEASGSWLHELRAALDERMPRKIKARYARGERASRRTF
ncbi:DUF559 domain-containing protein [Nocardioides guangzhouensis]|uniref:DUF559 domain-containing protein n=1 Tax=Nocardioides guangzhouensis TaxID=2497878 RepID=UPI0014384B23|nr:DUF559 domain-containing protein [Nocardioides guangzhouensis]